MSAIGRTAAAAVVAVVAVVAAGIVGVGPRGVGPTRMEPAGAAKLPESCSLLKSSEISRALGQPTGKGRSAGVPNVCDWTLAATPTLPMALVQTLVQRGATARKSYALAERFNADDREPLTGLGKQAFYAPSLGTVWVLENGTTVFYVQGLYPTGSTFDAPALRDALVGLAKLAEGRVQRG